MAYRIASLRFGTLAGNLQKRTLSTMMGSGFCRQSTQHLLRTTSRPIGRQDGLNKSFNKSTRRVFSKGTPKETPKEQGEKIVEQATKQTWMERFLGPKEMPEKKTASWYREMVLLCTVFAITGSSTMFMVRPAMSEVLGLKGSFREGPNSYRICSIVIMTPLYATMLVCVGTVFGRHAYFRHFAVKMFSRFGIPPELMDSTFHETAKNFRKW